MSPCQCSKKVIKILCDIVKMLNIAMKRCILLCIMPLATLVCLTWYGFIRNSSQALIFAETMLSQSCRHGLRMHDDQISNFLQPETIFKSQIEILVKCMKILVFCRKNELAMQNHRLGIHTVTTFEQVLLSKIP